MTFADKNNDYCNYCIQANSELNRSSLFALVVHGLS